MAKIASEIIYGAKKTRFCCRGPSVVERTCRQSMHWFNIGNIHPSIYIHTVIIQTESVGLQFQIYLLSVIIKIQKYSI